MINAPKVRCDQTGLDAANRSKISGLASTIGFVAGGFGVGLGLVLLVSEHPSAPRKIGETRGWLRAELLSAGPDGAMLGASGAF